jgi:DNA helicase-4
MPIQVRQEEIHLYFGPLQHHKPNLDSILPFLRNCSVEFKTIHSSKGLQADYVILLGLNTGSSAFPAEKEDDPLINLVLPQPENMPMLKNAVCFM